MSDNTNKIVTAMFADNNIVPNSMLKHQFFLTIALCLALSDIKWHMAAIKLMTLLFELKTQLAHNFMAVQKLPAYGTSPDQFCARNLPSKFRVRI